LSVFAGSLLLFGKDDCAGRFLFPLFY
jgi:hypothetical protein